MFRNHGFHVQKACGKLGRPFTPAPMRPPPKPATPPKSVPSAKSAKRAQATPDAALPADPAADEPVSGSAERSLRVLQMIASEGRPLSLAELTLLLGLPKGTVHRLCANLMASGYLARDVDERMFTVGPSMRQLAFDTLNHSTLRGLRHSVLTALVRDVGETCNFTTLDGTEVVYLDRVEARWPLRLTIDVGSHVPLHCTASGKLLLAHLPRRQRDTVIRRIPLPQLTPSTITTPEKLRAECDAIVAQGYSRDNEEFVAGLVAIAVPVRDGTGTVRATIALHAPTARVSMAQAEERLGSLRGAAEQMGKLL